MSLFLSFRYLFLLSAFGAMTFLLIPGCEETIFKPVLTGTEPDTTTHNWYFEVDTLGEHLSGARGIVAFSKDDAWVTGEFRIYKNPNDPGSLWDTYSYARWDGKKWKLGYFDRQYGNGATTLYAKNKNFMIAVENYFLLWNGAWWQNVLFVPGTFQGLNGIWAETPSIVHIVGGSGTWTLWDGNVENPSFRSLPTPTTIDLKDIYGDGDRIYACGTNQSNSRSVLLLYEKGTFTVIDSTVPGRNISAVAVWYTTKDTVLALADPMITTIHKGVMKHGRDSINAYPTMLAVRGSSSNNIWWAGHFLDMIHYNGVSFRHFRRPFQQSGQLQNISVSEDFFFATGYQRLQNGELRGIVVRGYRR